MKVLAIFDNGGETLDRYTFVTDEVTSYPDNCYAMLGTCATGKGFSQWGGGNYTPRSKNKHLGKQVQWYELPTELLIHVKERIA